MEVEKASLLELERADAAMVDLGRVDLDTANVFLKALSFKARTVGQNTPEFRICQNYMVFLEDRIRETMTRRIR